MPRPRGLTPAQHKCVAVAGRLMLERGMVHPGARIGVALSGGVDSFALLQILRARQAVLPFPVELMVLHVDPGFGGHNSGILLRWIELQGLSACFVLDDFGPAAHASGNAGSPPCFTCARARRSRLFDACRDFGLTHLALGHTAEDLAATFFMNLFKAGRVESMHPKSGFFGNTLTVIRPLLGLEKPLLVQTTRDWRLPVLSNPCPSKDTTQRSRFASLFAALSGEERRSLVKALLRTSP